MQFEYIDEQEAKALWEARVPVFNRYRNADRDSVWDNAWSEWHSISNWDEEDWSYLRHDWEDEFRVEVE